MEHYGNLPLIEPLEYKEVNRLEELVIAIDTSGSCSRELVQRFLGKPIRFSAQERIFPENESLHYSVRLLHPVCVRDPFGRRVEGIRAKCADTGAKRHRFCACFYLYKERTGEKRN